VKGSDKLGIQDESGAPFPRSTALVLLALLFLPLTLAAESWTVLVYMAGDNNLWQNAVQDVNDMESVPIPANLNLIVQTDLPAGSPYPGGQRRKISQDSSNQITSTLLASLGEVNSADPTTLNGFIRWGFNRYPAQRRMLVVWGHGDNWFKTPAAKWICPDDGAQALISVAEGELREALQDIPRLDILLFDACSMQSLEVLAEVMDKADHVIGSEELVPATGFPYQTMIPLFTGGAVEGIAADIPLLYLESYEPGGIQNPGGFMIPLTCSAIRTSYLDGFYTRFRDYFFDGPLYAYQIMLNDREYYWEMNTGYNDVDVGELLSSYQGWGGGIDELTQAWENSVAFSGSLNIPLHQVGSAAIWFPYNKQYFDAWWEHYTGLNFAAYRWLSVLNRCYGNPGEPPPGPIAVSHSQVLGSLNLNVTQAPYPDSLWYRLVYQPDEGTGQTQFAYPAFGQEMFSVRIPVQESGTILVYGIDPWGNESLPASVAFAYAPPGLDLQVTPNPVRNGTAAALRWFLPLEDNAISLSIYNSRGQLLWRQELTQAQAGEGIRLFSAIPELDAWGRGVYIAQLKRGRQLRRVKFTIL
jgi:hypothetical protein